MTSSRQKGFTLVEVMLFLALSGLFILIAFLGLRNRTENLRRTDSMRQIESYLTQQAQAVSTGTNESPNASGTDKDRILLGRMYRPIHGTGELEAYQIIGNRIDIVGREADDIGDLISDSAPRVDPVLQTFEMDWGLTLSRSFSKGGVNGRQVMFFGFLLNPTTNDSNFLVIEGTTNFASESDVINFLQTSSNYRSKSAPAGERVTYNQSVSLHLCFADTLGRISEVTGADGELQDVFEIKFDNNVLNRCITG